MSVMEFVPNGTLTTTQITKVLALIDIRISGDAFAALPEDLKPHFTPAAPRLGTPPANQETANAE